jgi:hypothetical protein
MQNSWKVTVLAAAPLALGETGTGLAMAGDD